MPALEKSPKGSDYPEDPHNKIHEFTPYSAFCLSLFLFLGKTHFHFSDKLPSIPMNGIPENNPRLNFFRSQIGKGMSNSISPLGRWLGGTLRAVGHGQISVEFTVREEMTNPMGTLHGGTAASMLDEAVGMMVFALGREFAYTSVNLNCDFLSAARLGDVLTANAEVVRAGRTVIHCEGELVTPEGKIVAKCASNLIKTRVKLPE